MNYANEMCQDLVGSKNNVLVKLAVYLVLVSADSVFKTHLLVCGTLSKCKDVYV